MVSKYHVHSMVIGPSGQMQLNKCEPSIYCTYNDPRKWVVKIQTYEKLAFKILLLQCYSWEVYNLGGFIRINTKNNVYDG